MIRIAEAVLGVWAILAVSCLVLLLVVMLVDTVREVAAEMVRLVRDWWRHRQPAPVRRGVAPPARIVDNDFSHRDPGDETDVVPEGGFGTPQHSTLCTDAYRVQRRNPRLPWKLAQAVAEARARRGHA